MKRRQSDLLHVLHRPIESAVGNGRSGDTRQKVNQRSSLKDAFGQDRPEYLSGN
jgi:hypothetical protein